MIYYKFQAAPNCRKLLQSFKGKFVELWFPDTNKEEYAYVMLEDDQDQFETFLDHFGDEGEVLKAGCEEWPDHPSNKMTNNRFSSFTLVKPR